MPAYVIVETDIHDPEQYERYKSAVPASLAAHGGWFIVRGGELAVLEGDWQAKRLREGAAQRGMVAVEGYESSE